MLIEKVVIFCISFLVLCLAHNTTSSIRDRRKILRPSRNESEVSMRMEKMVCNANPRYITFHSCDFQQINQRSITIDLHASIVQVCDQLQVRVRFSVLYGTDDERLLLDRWEDVCGYLSGAKKSYFLDLLYENVGKYTTTNQTCPFVGDYRLHADHINGYDIPARIILPTGRFRTDFSLANGPHRIFVARIKMTFSNLMRQIWIKMGIWYKSKSVLLASFHYWALPNHFYSFSILILVHRQKYKSPIKRAEFRADMCDVCRCVDGRGCLIFGNYVT